MKKSFFKKLSFVLASAMVLTAVAPASGAFAAKAPALNAKEKYLHLGVEGKDEFNFNIKNKKSGWKYTWTSANEDVVTVNKKNGVATAEGVGSTKVSVVIKGKDGKEVDELSAKVTVRDNIKSLTITNKPEGDKLAVGESNNFNRDFVTASGSTKKTSSITRWTVDKDTATIKDNGVFVASAAGEYTITAMAFQSKAKYNEWLADKEANAAYLLATDTYKVTVAPSMVAATQVDLDTFKVTFDSAVADAADKLTVYQMAGTAKVKELVKKVKMDAENKVATIDMYSITEGATYVVEYPDMEAVSFVAATAKVEDVASLKVKTTEVEIYKPTEIEVGIYNAEGVEITNDDLLARVDLEASNDKVALIDDELTMYSIGDTTQITATFHSYKYDNKTGEELGNITAVGVVRCVEEVKDKVGEIKAYTIADDDEDDPDFEEVDHAIAADETGKRLFVQLTMDPADGDEFDFDNAYGSEYEHEFEFKSSNESILMIDEELGTLFPVKAGNAVVVVKYDDKTVGAVAITVTADRKLASVSLDATSFVLSNGIEGHDDTKLVSLTVKDQYGDDYDNFEIDMSVNKAPKNGNYTINGADINDADGEITFRAGAGLVPGTYSFKVEVVDTNDRDIKKFSYVNVTVKEPADEIKYFAIETDKTSYDLKLENSNSSSSLPTINVSVYGYDKSGIKTAKLTLAELGVDWTDAPSVSGGVNHSKYQIAVPAVSGGSVTLVSNSVSGDAIYKVPTGSYRLGVADNKVDYDVDGDGDLDEDITVRPATIKVVDTQKKPVLTVKDWSSKKSNVYDAILECIEVKYDGDKVDSSEIIINASDITTTTYTVNVKKVYWAQTINRDGWTGTIYHEIKVDRVFRYNQ